MFKGSKGNREILSQSCAILKPAVDVVEHSSCMPKARVHSPGWSIYISPILFLFVLLVGFCRSANKTQGLPGAHCF